MQSNDKDLEKITGEVDAVQYKSDDRTFAVTMINIGDELLKVVGQLGDVEEGEEIVCMGNYVDHAVYGRQFRCVYCERSLPTSAAGIRKYLSGGVIEEIDRALAKKIVKKFGEDTLEILENEPEKLTQIEGIDLKTAKKMSEKFCKAFTVRSLISSFARFSLSTSAAVRCWKCLGDDAEKIINDNPYILTSEAIDIPFQKADEIAAEIGIPRTAEKRIHAGMTAILRRAANDGNTAYPLDALRSEVCPFLGIDEITFRKELDQMVSDDEIYLFYKGHEAYAMTPELFGAENYIARRLSIMSELSYDTEVDFSEVIDLAEEENGIEYEETQRKAINLALSKGFLVLTGGPGTGKTTTLNAILSLFEQQGLEVMLAAPTGRAAKRLSDLTGHEAKTIHRLLEVKASDDLGPISFVHNENDQLGCEVLIIDEMSMVDSCLFASVLKAIKINCKLVLVGDSDQLPSVGAGNVLHDIIESGVMPVVTLTEIFRQAQQSTIVTTAHKIVKGIQPDLADRSGDFIFMQRNGYTEINKLLVELCKTRLPDAFGYDPLTDIQVISPTRQGPCGTVELNKLLQEELNPPMAGRSGVKTKLFTFRKGDKVMQTRNDYDILWKRTDEDGNVEEGTGIFNGDIGIVTQANKILMTLTIDFEGREAVYTLEMMQNLELAYAVTVHKSQGSEYDAVIMTIADGFGRLSYRNLLYTGVTRAKKLLVVIGSIQQFRMMIQNDRKTLRYTCLKEMLTGSDGDPPAS